MEKRVPAFKLLCDAEGKLFAVEAGDNAEGFKPGQIIGNLLALEIAFPSQTISEVTIEPKSVGAAKLCCRIINGRLVCVPC